MTRKGSELPWSVLSEDDVKIILDCVDERKRLRAEANRLSNAALAKKFNVHRRTIEKAISGETWGHVMQ